MPPAALIARDFYKGLQFLKQSYLWGPPNQTELRHGRPQHTAGESHESNAPVQAILSVEK